MKKSYTLLITIVLITLFSYLAVSILETKSLKSINSSNQYLYIQGNNHKEFFKDYLQSINLTGINQLEIEDEIFEIIAKIENKNSIFTIDIFVKAKDYDVSIYEKLTIK